MREQSLSLCLPGGDKSLKLCLFDKAHRVTHKLSRDIQIRKGQTGQSWKVEYEKIKFTARLISLYVSSNLCLLHQAVLDEDAGRRHYQTELLRRNREGSWLQ